VYKPRWQCGIVQLWKGMSVDYCEQWRENLFVRMGVWVQQNDVYNASDWWVLWGTMDWL